MPEPTPGLLVYDEEYKTGQYSYYKNIQLQTCQDTAAMFPAGWGQPGELPGDAIWKNASEALWLPLHLPSGYDGHKGVSNMPDVIVIANPQNADIKNRINAAGEPYTQARYDEAAKMALEAAGYTAGSPYSRDKE